RALAENPDATRDIYAERCTCGAALEEAGQELARAWDHVDLPPIKPITTRINLFRATCPCCKQGVTARAPADMPEGSPFGLGIKAAVAYLHGCQLVGFKRLTELCEGLFGLTISQGAISNMLARMGKPFGAAAEQIAAIGLRAPLARSGVEWLPLVGWHPAIAERRTQCYSKSSKPRRCSLLRDRLADPFLHHVGDLV